MIVDLEPRAEGSVRCDGQRLAWQEFGAGENVVLLLPTWSIVHSDFWRHQVPVLAAHHRVITYDGLGNGASDRPEDARFYGDLTFGEHAVAVLDACAVREAAVMGVSQGGAWALALAARHPERVRAAAFIAPNVPLADGHPDRDAAEATFEDVVFSDADRSSDADWSSFNGWAKWNRHYWLDHYPDFLRFFFAHCFTEPDSQPEIDHFFAMGMQTTPHVLLATAGTEDSDLTPELARDFARRVRCPSLVIHGDEDAITPVARGEQLARRAGSELVVMAGSGHETQCRTPDVVNAMLEDFLGTVFDGGQP
jgi:pimeloyl-ACP methyl ester carboxylesterase